MMFRHYAQDNLLDHKKPHCFGSQEVPVEFFKGPIQVVIRESICLHDADLITKRYAAELNGQRYDTGLTVMNICLVLLNVLLCIKLKFVHLLKNWKPCLIIFISMHMTCWDNNRSSFRLRRIN